MSGFSPSWLALREPADAAARSRDVTRLVVESLAGRARLTVVDLGCGAGSNVRFLSPWLPAGHCWRVVDDDPELLDQARGGLPSGSEVLTEDLRSLPEGLLDGVDLVTASALLDLVSEAWLRQLVSRFAPGGPAVLFALNYDGRIECTPADADDEFVRVLVNAHQRTDKGFGPALGPASGIRAEALLRAAGYAVVRAPSDWTLGPELGVLQRELIVGWARAARELVPDEVTRLDAWTERRLGHVDRGASRLVVGHDDVGGLARGGEGLR